MDAASKHQVISDLIVKNNQVLAEMNELAQWKKEALPKLEKVSKEEIASEVLAKRIVELENDLSRSRSALAGLEEALMVSDHIIRMPPAHSIRHISHMHSSFIQTVETEIFKIPSKEEMVSSKEESTTWGYIRDV